MIVCDMFMGALATAGSVAVADVANVIDADDRSAEHGEVAHAERSSITLPLTM